MSTRFFTLIGLRNLKYCHPLRITSCMFTRYLYIYNHNKVTFQSHNLNSTQTTIDPPSWIQSTLDTAIYNASSANAILSLVEDNDINVVQAASMVITLCEKFGKDDKLQDINNAPEFKKLSKLICKNLQNLNNKSLLLVYRSMILLNIPTSELVVISLQNQILWKLRKMKISDIIKLVNLQLKFQKTSLDQQIINESFATISRRWIEINDVKDIVMLMNYSGNFSHDFQSKLENRALELVDKMTIDNFQTLVAGIVNMQQRPTPLLRAISYYIIHRQMSISVKDIISLIHSLKQLRYYDQTLLERLSQDLVSKVPLIEKSSQISMLLMCFGQMKWRHPSLLSMLNLWLTEHLNSCPFQHLTPFILTSASVNYLPDSADELVKKIVTKLEQESLDNNLLIDIVWSLAILEKLPLKLANLVLQPDSYKNLFGDASFESISNKLKLLNIQTAAKLEVPGYTGKEITNEIYNSNENMPCSKNKEVLCKSVVSSLTNFITSEKYLRTNVITPMGYTLAAEFFVTKDLRPVNYDNYSSVQSLPNGTCRVAVLVWDFNDFTQFSIELIGINQMLVRHLTKMGYYVLQVPYNEYSDIKTVVDRVHYLQKKLKEIINVKSVNKC